MKSAPKRIGIGLGNLGGFTDGLGEFSRQLCERLAAAAPALRETHGIELVFHLRPAFMGCFGTEVSYLPVTRWQRHRHVQPARFALWHSLNQLNKSLPPKGTPCHLVTVHDLNFFYFKQGFSFWRDLRRTRHLLNRTDHVIAISDHVGQDVRKRLGWQGPLDVIYNGARSLRTLAQEEVAGLQHRPFLFHLSRMSPSKNVDALLDLARHWPSMHFVLAGADGGDSRAVQARLVKAPLPNVTVLLGISDAQKAWLYAHCTGFLFPSLTEGFGLPPIEAMHFGKPVFLSDRTCLPEIGGRWAAYFDRFDAPSMKRVIEQALPTLQAASDGIVRHAAGFDWDRCARDHLDLYVRLVDSAPLTAR